MAITGTSSSRLTELRKYTVTNVFADQYIGGGNYFDDGVDYVNSVSGESIVYYLGGIKYVDTIVTGTTTQTRYQFEPEGTGNTNNFISVPYYKDPKKERIVSNPKIDNDVFIIRQELSVFENNYRLQYVDKLVELTTYAGGNYFKIINNT
jgi:hypothetical protein